LGGVVAEAAAPVRLGTVEVEIPVEKEGKRLSGGVAVVRVAADVVVGVFRVGPPFEFEAGRFIRIFGIVNPDTHLLRVRIKPPDLKDCRCGSADLEPLF
jgi:hypothetical protein